MPIKFLNLESYSLQKQKTIRLPLANHVNDPQKIFFDNFMLSHQHLYQKLIRPTNALCDIFSKLKKNDYDCEKSKKPYNCIDV